MMLPDLMLPKCSRSQLMLLDDYFNAAVTLLMQVVHYEMLQRITVFAPSTMLHLHCFAAFWSN